MSAPAKVSTLPEVPAEVLSFAAKKGVGEWLYPVLEMTVRAYPGRSTKLYVEYDHEDPDWQYIVLQTERGNESVEEHTATYDALGDEFVQSIPPRARQYFVNICL